MERLCFSLTESTGRAKCVMWGVGRRMQCIDLTLGTSPKKYSPAPSSTNTAFVGMFQACFYFAVEKLNWMCKHTHTRYGRGGKKRVENPDGVQYNSYSNYSKKTTLRFLWMLCLCWSDAIAIHSWWGYRHTAMQWVCRALYFSSMILVVILIIINTRKKNFLETVYSKGCSERWHNSKFQLSISPK